MMMNRIVTGDSRGYVQIWDIMRRRYGDIELVLGLMTQNHKAHEGDVLTVSVFCYIDQASDIPSDSHSPTTLIVSGGVDAKVQLCVVFHSLALCLQ